MLAPSEKQGGNDFRNVEVEIFRHVMANCNLHDLGYIGHDFTWINNRGGAYNLHERLDQFLATPSLRTRFLGSIVLHLSKRKSDHLPILLFIKGDIRVPKKKKEKENIQI
ncbi:Protein FAR1-RELATED SEQUENCE 2 [Bienertia sinuspersici]